MINSILREISSSPTRHLRALLSSIGILALLVAVGCAGDDESVDHLDEGLTRAGAIVDPTNTGMVEFVNSAGICSGTLVRNQWVLTAEHCWAGGWDQVAGAFVRMGTQAAWVQKAFPVSYAGIIDTSTDAMLLKLDRPLLMNGSTTGWQRGLSFVTRLPAQTQLGCWGYGKNDLGVVDHLLRLTTDEYINGWSGSRVLLRNTEGQHIQQGDSGGPCLYFDGTIVGVIHGQEPDANNSWLDLITPSDMFSFWFDLTLASN